jgi:hypothetical protein
MMCARMEVQRRHRLVEHDEPRMRGQGTGDGQALALPTAELMRKEARHVGPEAD